MIQIWQSDPVVYFSYGKFEKSALQRFLAFESICTALKYVETVLYLYLLERITQPSENYIMF